MTTDHVKHEIRGRFRLAGSDVPIRQGGPRPDSCSLPFAHSKARGSVTHRERPSDFGACADCLIIVRPMF